MQGPSERGDALRGKIEAIMARIPRERMNEASAATREAERGILAARIKAAKVPPRFSGGEMATAEARRWVRGCLEGSPRNLVLTGRAGSGKTREACAALEAVAGSKTCLYATFGDVLRDVRATYGGEGSERSALSRYRTVGVLLMDDLGKERPTPDALEKLFAVLDARYASMRPTVFTTQYGRDALGRRLMAEGGDFEQADAILRRVYQDAEVVVMGGR